jgi:hypothetical protein
MCHLIENKLTPSFRCVGMNAHLGMGLKGYAMFDELLPLIRRPFQLTNLYQLDTNIFDSVDYAPSQSFDMLDELQNPDQGLFQ